MCKRMSFSFKFRVTNVDCSFDASPCFFHILSRACKFEIIHINNQHAIVLSMVPTLNLGSSFHRFGVYALPFFARHLQGL